MRALKITVIVSLCIFGIYSLLMNFVDESKDFTHYSEVNYPVEKVFPQFNNLQNFSSWNDFFLEHKESTYNFYKPYEGLGSGMSFKNNQGVGDLFIKYSNTNRTIRYQLFDGEHENPYLIDVKFQDLKNKTKLTWRIYTPKRSYLSRAFNLFTEDYFVRNIDKSISNLHNHLSNKIDKDERLASVKYDSLMVEDREEELLLGVNVSTKNKKDGLFKNVLINHGKVINYVTNDLKKKEDEFGSPKLIVNPNNLKDKEISYFYGVPLSKKISISDNNFSFQTVNSSKQYIIYYQGQYNSRLKSVQQLLSKAKKDTMRNGLLVEEFLENPSENQVVKLKLSLQVYR